jgi:cytochrome P450/NADPH-cytochrome P450 reductase
MADVVPIPSPPGYPLIGNLTELTGNFTKDMKRLADTYGTSFSLKLYVTRQANEHALTNYSGEIWRLNLGGGRTNVYVASQKLVNEVCDEKRFRKTLSSVISVRNNRGRKGKPCSS